jgi:hypothetical protein
MKVEGTCDICGNPAQVVRPPTRKSGKRSGFERMVLCMKDARRTLGWGDTFYTITPTGIIRGFPRKEV